MPTPLEDREAIRELLHRYNHLIDALDLDAWVELFAPDGVFEADGIGTVQGHEALRGFFERIPRHGDQAALRHLVTNEVIDVRGERATARAYLLLVNVVDAPALTMVGQYEDTLTRLDGRWRFARRVFRAATPP